MNREGDSVKAPAVQTGDRYADLFCPECDYNLRGLLSDRCPECGQPIDFARLVKSQIPWTDRARIGMISAYVRTVWLVMFRNRRFCGEIMHPVSYSASQSFRWATVTIAYVSAAVPLTLFWMGMVPVDFFDSSLMYGAALILLHECLYLCLVAVTGVPSYFFHPQRLSIAQQNRAVAMSYYACAPLAWLPLALVMGTVALVIAPFSEDTMNSLLVLAGMIPIGLFVCWWVGLIRIARRSLRQNTATVVGMAGVLPILWVVVGGGILVLIPAVVAYVVVIFVTLS